MPSSAQSERGRRGKRRRQTRQCQRLLISCSSFRFWATAAAILPALLKPSGFEISAFRLHRIAPNSRRNGAILASEIHGFGQTRPKQYFVPDEAEENTPAPVYITIGPPAAGKTEALKFQLEQDGYDGNAVLSSQEVALDEQSEVYQRVPLAAFIFPTSRLDAELGAKMLRSGVTVSDRLIDPSPPPLDKTDVELRNIILRLAGRITPTDFADRSRDQAIQAGDTVRFFQNRRREVAEDLIQAVEQVSVQAIAEVLFQMQLKEEQMLVDVEDDHDLPYDDKKEQTDDALKPKLDLSTINATSAHLLSAKALIRTPFVDLFVPHALFHGGIDRAEDKLQDLLDTLPSSHPVCWGNTNTRPVEYVAALRAAERAGRPVKFVAWGLNPHMPRVPRQELLRRTVSKFRETGRYIPAGAVGAALGRVETLIREAEKETAKLVGVNARNKTKLSDTFSSKTVAQEYQASEVEIPHIHAALAALAGFVMDADGFVMQVAEPRNFNRKPSRTKKKSGRRDNPQETLQIKR